MQHFLEEHGRLLAEGISFLIIMGIIVADIYNGGLVSKIIIGLFNSAM